MDWRIESSDVSYMAQNERGQSIIMPYEEQRVLYRSDTHAPLSVVSQRYQEVQPKQILEFYRDLTEQSGFELETAGVLKGGKKFWALAKTGQTSALKGKDVSNGYILLATACDGTLATTAQFTSIRVVCNNTLAIALKGQNSSAGVVKVPHSTKFDAEKIKQQLGISVRAWEDHMYEMKQLSQRKVTQTEAAAYFDAVFNNTSLSVPEQEDGIIQFYRNVAMQAQSNNPATKAENKTEPNGRAMSKVMTMFNGQGRGAELSSVKDTAYGLLCSITEFADHERRAMSQDHRLDSAWFGAGAGLKQRGLEQALAMIA
ncbi:phage/plasmid-related protein TIGR03299 [Acinetobacter johnsonii SH046]|uniref:Phage/plasmid-related protein TIGR03299 n=2 Tax=Acinetobacter johnsonii TaxID=40214 RepID=D0S8N1_ACIJO|nr:phage/plasmid-related protein TIGR03299 [Acinetobacter johnsonii SH046]